MNNSPDSRSLSILIYVLPAIADMVVAQFFFINAVRLARMGASASVVANTITTWGIVYLLTCPVLGRFGTPKNAAPMMMVGLGGMTLISTLFTVIPGIAGIYVLTGLVAIGAALFFVPFQIFMKAIDEGNQKTVSYSTGLYTFSWSLGFACGPFVSGFLMEQGTEAHPGWMFACWFAAGASALACALVYVLKRLADATPRLGHRGIEAPPPGALDYSKRPDMAWLGWLGGGIGILALSFVRGVFPARAEAALHLSQSMQGLIFFLLSLAQALTGLILCRSRTWMYERSGMLAFGLAGILGSLALGFARSPLLLGAAAVLFGVYAGGFFFYLVFHALIHPARSSRYVAVNESVVGIATLLGALIGGGVADLFGFGSLYSLGAMLILTFIIFQTSVTAKTKEV